MFDLDIRFTLPHWLYWGGLLVFPLIMMGLARLLDARKRVGPHPSGMAEAIEGEDSSRLTEGNAFTRTIDAISRFIGNFVAWWSVIAVVVYFYEVVARYFFNSPTNWTHESMFLMFGMLYVLSGAYAFLYDAHVRVDLFYAKASPRGRAALDISTSFFFIIFGLALMWTTWTFFSNSLNQETVFFASGYFNEVSFTEWAVAYWPVKGIFFLGSVLLFLQGVSRLVKDILVFTGRQREA